METRTIEQSATFAAPPIDVYEMLMNSEKHTALSGEPATMALADIEPFVKAEVAKWAEVVKKAGIKID